MPYGDAMKPIMQEAYKVGSALLAELGAQNQAAEPNIQLPAVVAVNGPTAPAAYTSCPSSQQSDYHSGNLLSQTLSKGNWSAAAGAWPSRCLPVVRQPVRAAWTRTDTL